VEMAATGISSIKVKGSAPGFTAVLSSAACEWFLIFLLLVDAVLSYLLTKFASYCNLQAPCILCSRLDHLLGNENPKFYRHLLCSNHRSEISSLISCHIHGKLAEGSGICEDCLLSFTMKNKSNPETRRLLVGILGMDLVGYDFQSPMLSKDFISGSMGTKLCSCCNKPWRSRQNSQRLLQLQSCQSGVTKPYIPLPRLPSRSRLKHRNSLKKIRGKLSGSVTSRHLGNSGFDPLSHVGYSKLKITSDSESEFPFSDDDCGSGIIREKIEAKEDFAVQCTSEFPSRALSSGLDLKLPSHLYNIKPSLLDPCVQPDVSKYQDVKFLASRVAIEHCLSEVNWQQVNQKSGPSAPPELISLDDIPPLANVMDVPHEGSTESTPMLPLCWSSNATTLAELITLADSPPTDGASPEKCILFSLPLPLSMCMYVCVCVWSFLHVTYSSYLKCFAAADVTGGSDSGHVSINEYEEVLKLISTTAGASVKGDQAVNDLSVIKPVLVDPGDVHKQAVNLEEREASDVVAEQLTVREPDRVNEELKLLPAHDYSAQQIYLSSNSTSPILPGCCDEQHRADTSSYNGTRMLQKSVSVESSLESLDGSLSEIEGESLLDRLKRQVEYDRKCIRALYKEVDEERNASAVSANQAMAMITRVQEEKAALHMEALQYLRMMEEQAEYDVEALEKANDLLAEKEKEIQDLEAEVEFCKSNLPIESTVEIIHEGSSDLKGENVILESTSVPSFTNNVNFHCKSMMTEVSKDSDISFVAETTCLDFEDEKLYISECLKKLERKLYQISSDRTLSNMPYGGHSEKFIDGRNDQEESLNIKVNQSNGQMEENCLNVKKDLHLSNGNSTSHEGSTASDGDDHFVCKEKNFFYFNGRKHSMNETEIGLVALEYEISDLNDRLESLEADHDFLERSLNFLQNGNEGLQFVQEIAYQLQELRKIGIRLRCQSDS